MNFRNIALAAIIGLSVPVVADLVVPEVAIAQRNYQFLPMGVFSDGEWEVFLGIPDDRGPGARYTYGAEHLPSGERITLRGYRETRNSTATRREYVWNNGSYEYIVAWQPDDPTFIRVRVIDPNGREIFNRLMEQVLTIR